MCLFSTRLKDSSAAHKKLELTGGSKKASGHTGLLCGASAENSPLDVDRPPHSYIALISMAILSRPERKILLNEIYDWVVTHFPYYRHRTDKSWRNSIRHNLSLNECFVKVGKAGNGRGYYWSIHHANMLDFKRGDFRRRQARLRAKHDKAKTSDNTTTTTTSTKSKRSHHPQASNDLKERGYGKRALLVLFCCFWGLCLYIGSTHINDTSEQNQSCITLLILFQFYLFYND